MRRLSLAFSAFTGNVPLDFCIYACVMSVLGPLKLLLKDSSFFKNILGHLILMELIFKCSFAPFHHPFIGNSKKIGHTGFAGTKK